MITQRALSQALGSRGLVCPCPPQGSPRPGDRGVARHRACVLHADKRVEPGRRRSRGLPLRPGSGAPTNGGGRVCSKGFLAANLSLPPPTHPTAREAPAKPPQALLSTGADAGTPRPVAGVGGVVPCTEVPFCSASNPRSGFPGSSGKARAPRGHRALPNAGLRRLYVRKVA